MAAAPVVAEHKKRKAVPEDHVPQGDLTMAEVRSRTAALLLELRRWAYIVYTQQQSITDGKTHLYTFAGEVRTPHEELIAKLDSLNITWRHKPIKSILASIPRSESTPILRQFQRDWETYQKVLFPPNARDIVYKNSLLPNWWENTMNRLRFEDLFSIDDKRNPFWAKLAVGSRDILNQFPTLVPNESLEHYSSTTQISRTEKKRNDDILHRTEQLLEASPFEDINEIDESIDKWFNSLKQRVLLDVSAIVFDRTIEPRIKTISTLLSEYEVEKVLLSHIHAVNPDVRNRFHRTLIPPMSDEYMIRRIQNTINRHHEDLANKIEQLPEDALPMRLALDLLDKARNDSKSLRETLANPYQKITADSDRVVLAVAYRDFIWNEVVFQPQKELISRVINLISDLSNVTDNGPLKGRYTNTIQEMLRHTKQFQTRFSEKEAAMIAEQVQEHRTTERATVALNNLSEYTQICDATKLDEKTMGVLCDYVRRESKTTTNNNNSSTDLTSPSSSVQASSLSIGEQRVESKLSSSSASGYDSSSVVSLRSENNTQPSLLRSFLSSLIPGRSSTAAALVTPTNTAISTTTVPSIRSALLGSSSTSSLSLPSPSSLSSHLISNRATTRENAEQRALLLYIINSLRSPLTIHSMAVLEYTNKMFGTGLSQDFLQRLNDHYPAMKKEFIVPFREDLLRSVDSGLKHMQNRNVEIQNTSAKCVLSASDLKRGMLEWITKESIYHSFAEYCNGISHMIEVLKTVRLPGIQLDVYTRAMESQRTIQKTLTQLKHSPAGQIQFGEFMAVMAPIVKLYCLF